MNSRPDVFIIESLHPEDEGRGRFEGAILAQFLRLHRKKPEHRYVRTREEFSEAVSSFGKSRYRYLHISAHGDKDGICTTNAENIDYPELADLLQPHLKDKRLFLSSCQVVHEKMAAKLIPTTRCLSVIGPTKKIRFSDAAVVWAAIYHLMFRKDPKRMGNDDLKTHLSQVCELFAAELKFFSRSTSEKGFKNIRLADL